MTPEFRTALVRGGISAFVAAGGAFFTALGLDLSLAKAAISAGSAAFVVLAARFGAEGAIDNKRAQPPSVP